MISGSIRPAFSRSAALGAKPLLREAARRLDDQGVRVGAFEHGRPPAPSLTPPRPAFPCGARGCARAGPRGGAGRPRARRPSPGRSRGSRPGAGPARWPGRACPPAARGRIACRSASYCAEQRPLMPPVRLPAERIERRPAQHLAVPQDAEQRQREPAGDRDLAAAAGCLVHARDQRRGHVEHRVRRRTRAAACSRATSYSSL